MIYLKELIKRSNSDYYRYVVTDEIFKEMNEII